jgi:hypothetical protein
MDTPANIIKGFPGKVISLKTENKQKAKSLLSNMEGIESIYSFGDALHITMNNSPEALKAVLDSKLEAEYQLAEIEPGFEDCFLQLMTEEKHV